MSATVVGQQMILRGGPISPFVRKVGICLIEKGLERQVACVRSFVSMATVNTELQQFNPLSRIPTLISAEGMTLFDSDVICEYLDSNFSSPTLIPVAGPARWQALRWCALGSGLLEVLVLWRNERNRRIQQQSPELLDAFRAKSEITLNVLEREIPVLDGTRFGIAHIAIGCVFGYLDFRFGDIDWRASHPRSLAWFETFMKRPSALRTSPYETAPGPECEPHLWKPE